MWKKDDGDGSPEVMNMVLRAKRDHFVAGTTSCVAVGNIIEGTGTGKGESSVCG